MPTLSAPASAKSLDEIHLEGLGFKGWNFNPQTIRTAASAASGTMRLASVPVRIGVPITKIHVQIAVVPTTITVLRGGIWLPSSNALLASSAHDGTAFNSVGIATLTLSSAYTPTTNGVLWFGSLVVCSGTAPSYGTTDAVTGKGLAYSTNPAYTVVQTALADLPDPLVPVANTVSMWYAWS